MLKKARLLTRPTPAVFHPPTLSLPIQTLRPRTRLIPCKTATPQLTIVSRFTFHVSRLTFPGSWERCENKAGGLFQYPANLWALVGALRPIRKGTPWIFRHPTGESGGLYLCRHQGRSHAVHDGHRQSTPGERRHHGVRTLGAGERSHVAGPVSPAFGQAGSRKRKRDPVSTDRSLAYLPAQRSGERPGAQRVGVSSEESRPAGHRNRDQRAQTILSGDLSRPRRLTGLYRLPQRSSAQPETGL